jgi:hypothetical protein
MRGSDFVPPPAQGIFNDVPPGSFAADWIEQLAADGISSGCGNGNFCPDDPVGRDEMAVMLERAISWPGTASPAPAVGLFFDVPIGYWADVWIEQLANDGITSGCGNGNFCPTRIVLRDEMAVFLDRAFGL